MIQRVVAVSRRSQSLLAFAALILAWQLTAGFASTTVLPAPSSIVRRINSDGLSTYLSPLSTTLTEAALGFGIGVAFAIVLGLVASRFALLLSPITQLATLTYTVPSFVVGAVLVTVEPIGRVRIAVAALYVVFTSVIGVVTGLQAAEQTHVDVVHVAGGNAFRQLMLIRIPASLPAVFSALKIAAPSAILGAVVAEYIGGTTGIGVAMVGAQRSGDVPRTWGLALVITAASLLCFVLIGLIGRRCLPWARESAGTQVVLQIEVPSLRARVSQGALRIITAVVVALGVWWALLAALHVNSFVARTPAQVIRVLTQDPDGIRETILRALGTTLSHTALGFAAGVAGGVVLASLFVLSPMAERLMLPLVLVGQSVPIVAFLPLALLALGRGSGVVLFVAGLVAFFPTLVNVNGALRTTPSPVMDVLTGLGTGPLRCLVKARLPYAAPAIFASVRIAAPTAFTGALLVEWLALGNGLGGLMATATASYSYDELWSSLAVGAVASVLVAAVARAAQRSLAHRLHLSAPAL